MGIKYWGVEEIHLSLFCQTCTLSQRPKGALEKVSHVNFYFLFKKCENNFSPFLDKFSCVKNCGSNAMLSFSFTRICLFHQNLPITPEFACYTRIGYFTRACLFHQNLLISPEFAYITRICLFHQNLPISPGLNSDPETIRRLVQGLDTQQFSNLTLELLALLSDCLDTNWSSFWHMPW